MKIKVVVLLVGLLPAIAFGGDGKPKSKVEKALCFADLDGNFSFQDIPGGDYTIEISFLSYETKTLKNFQIAVDSKSKRFFL